MTGCLTSRGKDRLVKRACIKECDTTVLTQETRKVGPSTERRVRRKWAVES